MIKIVKVDDKGNITLTEEELNILLKEAYNEGYDKGYEWGKHHQQFQQFDINKWKYKLTYSDKTTEAAAWKYNPTVTSNAETYKVHPTDSENGVPQ